MSALLFPNGGRRRRRSRVDERDPEYAEQLAALLRLAKLPAPVAEHRFHPDRKWAFDLAYPDARLAVEVEGGSWAGGRHTRGRGFQEDCRKYNAAVLAGWRLVRVTGAMVESGEAVATIADALTAFGPTA